MQTIEGEVRSTVTSAMTGRRRVEAVANRVNQRFKARRYLWQWALATKNLKNF